MWIAARSCNFYKALPTLRHIALVYQDQMRVEHYRKTDLGWELETLTHADDVLLFDALHIFHRARQHLFRHRADQRAPSPSGVMDTTATIPAVIATDRLHVLRQLERKLLWLSSWMIHNANDIRPNRDGLKVGDIRHRVRR